MKKIKMAIRAVLLAGLLSCLVLGVTACKADGEQENRTGEWVITLEEAYKKKLLSKSDLREISEKFPGHKSEDNPEETLILEYGAERIEAVKKAEAENINNGINPFYSRAESSDGNSGKLSYEALRIIGYYGTYNRCVILEMNLPGALHQMVYEVYIGGVKFSYTETFVKVWVKD